MIHGASQKLYLHQVNILFNAKNQIVYTNQQNLIYQKLFFLPCLAQVFFFNDFFVIDRLNKELIYDFFFAPRAFICIMCKLYSQYYYYIVYMLVCSILPKYFASILYRFSLLPTYILLCRICNVKFENVLQVGVFNERKLLYHNPIH